MIGEWREIEYHGSNGADNFVQRIENGRIFIFEEPNKIRTLKDGLISIGNYRINGDSLQTTFLDEENYYILIHLYSGNLALSPMTEKYEISCDEGCSYVFERIK